FTGIICYKYMKLFIRQRMFFNTAYHRWQADTQHLYLSAPSDRLQRLQPVFQISCKLIPELISFKSKLYSSFEEALLVPHIIAPADEVIGIVRARRQHRPECVCQLYLPALAR